jgi:hypothetical protein
MNKKDYKKIAKIINEELEEWSVQSEGYHSLMEISKKLADYIETEAELEDVELFNRKQFLMDCGVEE